MSKEPNQNKPLAADEPPFSEESATAEKPLGKATSRYIIVALLLILLGAVVYSSLRNRAVFPGRPEPEVGVSPGSEEVREDAGVVKDTVLYFGESQPVNTGSVMTIPIMIATGQNSVTAVDLYLNFPAGSLRNVRFDPGSFFAAPQVLAQEINELAGTTRFVLGGMSPQQGQGDLVTLLATVFPPEEGLVISFGKETGVAAAGETGNVLRESYPSNVSYQP